MNERVRLNTAIVLPRDISSTPKTVSFELEAHQSLLDLVDLCLKPHLAAQSIAAPDLRLWPAALFQQNPVTLSDLSEPNLRPKVTQAFSPVANAPILSQFHLRQLRQPGQPAWQNPNVIHLVLFPQGHATFHHYDQQQQQPAVRAHPPPPQPQHQDSALAAAAAAAASTQANPMQSNPSSQTNNSRPIPSTAAPQNHLPFLQYLSMSQPSAAVDHVPFLQNMPPSLGHFGMPNAQVNPNLDPMLAAMSSSVRSNMGMPMQPNGQHDPNHLRSSMGMHRDMRQDIHIGSASGSMPQGSIIRSAPDEDDLQQPAEKRPRMSEGSTSSRRSSTKADGPRYTCDEKHENDDSRTCGASFARPYDLNRHKSTKHNIGPSVTKSELACTICNRVFSRRDALLRHQRVKNHNSSTPPVSALGFSGSGPQDTASIAASILGATNGS